MGIDLNVDVKSEKEYIAESLKDAVEEMNAKKKENYLENQQEIC
ncbi:hypothetical protein [Aquibacillus albus]|uniref:Uncharacterized protein n=1 Tax=Aquibacillus albus TaxID=1168171 RepID=A0ABS2MZM5_9BACI|nr:hypothetical protein [Aquibacillus albus]MBM7571356.1 hypothetical protein [Aquibacillus albus]